MSGHSHYATIKRQKESRDAAKGKIFSKMARAIQIAVKLGGSPDPSANSRLRDAIEMARSYNMPKENIERAISKGTKSEENLEEVVYEGFGPGGVAIIVETATDNRNRTGQEIKNLLERGGGSLAGPGAVSFNFETKGFLLVEKKEDVEKQMLSLIDLGVEDIEEVEDAIEVYVPVDKLGATRDKLEMSGFKVKNFEIVKRPKNFQDVNDETLARRILSLLDNLDNHDDVQKVYSNVNIPSEILQKLT